MDFFMCGGDDDVAVRQHQQQLLARYPHLGPAERLDAAVDAGAGLVEAAASPSLFTPGRLVVATGGEKISEAHADALAKLAADSDAVLIVRSVGAVPPKVRKILAGLGDVHAHAVPRGRQLEQRVADIGAVHGLTLGAGQRRLLVERAGHDLPRVDGICLQLAAVGLTAPTVAQVERLLGSSSAAGVPWDVSDQLESGRLAQALALAERAEPLAVLGYLVQRTVQAGRVADSGVQDARAAMELLGLSHAFQAEKVMRLASRLGVDGCTRSLGILLEASAGAKRGRDPQVMLDLALGRLASAWSGSGWQAGPAR